MDLLNIYESFSDATRLRILHLLTHRDSIYGPDLRVVLEEPQVKVSRQLTYLRRRELVEVFQEGSIRYYSLPHVSTKELNMNLNCLKTLASHHLLFKRDLSRLKQHAPQHHIGMTC